jgi:signal transduction histidine kinase
MSMVVLLAVAGLAVASFFVSRAVVADSEHRLLLQRTEEAGVTLAATTNTVQTSLGSLAATASGTPSNTAAFRRSAQVAIDPARGYAGVALVALSPQPHVISYAGTGVATLTPPAVAAVRRAVAGAQRQAAISETPIAARGALGKRLGFAYASNTEPGIAVYAEARIHPTQPSPATSSQPFGELAAALYVGRQARPDQLLVSTVPLHSLPLRGHVARTRTPVGSDGSWLLVARARHSLVGGVALAMPWALLIGGLVGGALAAAVVEVLARRREYAEQLVTERTAELARSLEELAAAQGQLVRQERLAAIGELAATVGHELRNPLAVINNAVYLLRHDFGPQPPEAAQRHLATAEREVAAATVIVSDLLEFARQRQPAPAELDLCALVDEVAAVLAPPAGVTVVREQPAEAVVVRADRDMLRQLLVNLVGNAYQAMPDGGTVSIRVRAVAGAVELVVADTGEGMSDEVRERIFEPFFTTKARGVGLGLAVCHHVVSAHGGDVAVATALGAGTQFTVTLPTSAVPAIAQQRRPPAIETGADAHA